MKLARFSPFYVQHHSHIKQFFFRSLASLTKTLFKGVYIHNTYSVCTMYIYCIGMIHLYSLFYEITYMPAKKNYVFLYLSLLILKQFDICFWLRLGLANAINNYLRLKIQVVYEENLKVFINWIRHTISGLDLFVCQNFLNWIFKPVFEYKINFWILCPRVVNLQRLFCSVKAGVQCSYY